MQFSSKNSGGVSIYLITTSITPQIFSIRQDLLSLYKAASQQKRSLSSSSFGKYLKETRQCTLASQRDLSNCVRSTWSSSSGLLRTKTRRISILNSFVSVRVELFLLVRNLYVTLCLNTQLTSMTLLFRKKLHSILLT